ncbi:hypothetical protein [Alteromonas australica]|uniref:Pectate lyase superfamily protein domain-containing protein n=2 Tax=Alteromonas australica TaxID=589873 RepID=A0A358E111_9ALTE|nr:hypothetical protein [Alteromonas australica]MBU35301.1 hypothetical protein [Alteromonas sp.]HBU52211.1 hypothetical protein [Alteromonas australica]|tara:strand:- start:4410 stop:6338 length:1929 start_codon:yes stop_codon:yes gene_type:complete
MAEIEKLQALAKGTPGNSTGEDVANAVNALIDEIAALLDSEQVTRWPSFSEVTGMVSKNQLPPVSSKVNSVFDAIADTELGVGELVKTVSYHGDIGSVMLARGGNTYLKISGQSNTEDGCRYIYTNDGNTLVGLFPDGFIRPEQAGAKGDGTTNDADAIQAANSLISDLVIGLKFSSKDYFVGTSSFIIDALRGFWHGETQSRIIFSGAPSAGYGVQLVGAPVYESNDRMVKSALKNISIVGGAKNSEYDADAIQLSGGTAATRISCCSLDWVSVQGFKRTFRFNDHCWKVSVNNCRTIGGYIETPSSTVDFGECMVLRDCFFADSSGQFSNFRKGEWRCFGTSFDNQPFATWSDTIFSMNQCHIENPNNQSTSVNFVESNSLSKIMIRDSWITTNNRALIKPPLTSNAPDTTTGGIFLDNVTWNMNGDYDPQGNGYAHNYIIGGTGRSGVKGMHWLGFQTYWPHFTSPWANQILNGDFETGDAEGWTVRIIDTSGGTNASSSITATTTDPYSGTYCGQLSATYGGGGGVQGGELYQALSCKPNDLVVFGLYIKNDWDASNDVGLFQILVYFYDAAGNQISDESVSRLEGLQSSWTYRSSSIIAPRSACRVEVVVQALASVDTPTTINAWVDEFHVEVQELM